MMQWTTGNPSPRAKLYDALNHHEAELRQLKAANAKRDRINELGRKITRIRSQIAEMDYQQSKLKGRY